MYRSKAYRKYQYSVITTWPGGVYASPSMAGSRYVCFPIPPSLVAFSTNKFLFFSYRPGAIIAGAFASMMHLGIDGYTKSCREIVGAAKKLEAGIRKDFSNELFILGEPKVSVIAFGSLNEDLKIYEVGDKMSKLGWHCEFLLLLLSLLLLPLSHFISSPPPPPLT